MIENMNIYTKLKTLLFEVKSFLKKPNVTKVF